MKKVNAKKILFIFIVFMLSQCGYSPIFKDVNNTNFSISLEKINGNRNINNKIKSKLSGYVLNDANKYFKVNLNSDYKKNIVAKDTTGAATEYKIIIETTFYVSSENFQRELNYKESFNMQSFSDKLEEQDYEESIQDSLTNIIVKKLILQLSQIK